MELPSGPEIRTYRYVRLAMIAVLLMLAVSVVIERVKTDPGCWQGSISAYYYTPVHAVFVGALLAVAVCMVVLKGNTNLEDVLLNLGGMFAPVVALVPTPNAGSCWSERVMLTDATPSIVNNMWGLFAAGGLGIVITIWLWRKAEPGDWDQRQTIALVVSIGIFVVGLIWFIGLRSNFEANAHYWTAVLLFVMIIWIVFQNARQSRNSPEAERRLGPWPPRLYFVIAGLMAVCVILGLVGWRADWRNVVLLVEAALILLFLAFWAIQTVELWDRGLRADPSEPEAKHLKVPTP
ncbi:hypothetical protein EV643_11291 [Kribbella sp. VKM Ac-2527]|uniref:Uncharacterized protein n=1 Tax=Kribbella caucasensis TaxID=2512215 RepID=A0A4R6K9B6_9ACTN|nr:hypothetical protein [Kribbella sp. VKM Ac-2527]TDO45767.1 hypothetical protein EV643_11291 [Kribbella sp. VKM Ac-2527]